MKSTLPFTRAVVLFFCLAGLSHAKFLAPQLTPVDRLIKNAAAYLDEHRTEPDAHYTLARIHYLAFVTQRDKIPAYTYRPENQGKPSVIPNWMADRNHEGISAAERLSKEQMIDHARKALQSFNSALTFLPKNSIFQLGLASLLEDFVTWKDLPPREQLPLEFRDISLDKARLSYAKAFLWAQPQENTINRLPIDGIHGIVTYEAATGYLRMADKYGYDSSGAEKGVMSAARNAVARIQGLPSGPVTPIVFSFQPVARLHDLLAPETIVDFDLRGYGVKERWPWVKPELGFLVWDPRHSCKINSACQLFGGYTFEILRKTGYDALAALDDDHDGSLSGPEIDGIGVWFDRNCDGRSTADEVTPVQQLGITAIATHPDSNDGRHPTAERGLTLKDGRILRTWDWIVEPVSSAGNIAAGSVDRPTPLSVAPKIDF